MPLTTMPLVAVMDSPPIQEPNAVNICRVSMMPVLWKAGLEHGDSIIFTVPAFVKVSGALTQTSSWDESDL